jgi:hypothetical protein
MVMNKEELAELLRPSFSQLMAMTNIICLDTLKQSLRMSR